ncbi:unnamed protein product [Arabis nemorensis]|uniref:Uncharacterized protein n=1 Tax=Arabis nemorensis TaxID=586526 RepID=A0A565CC19_9BRAS|nr:unnamed protein product [Arabis nemorensis]
MLLRSPTTTVIPKGLKIHQVQFSTQHDEIFFDCYESSQVSGPSEMHYFGAHCGILFVDVTESRTCSGAQIWYDNIKNLCGEILVVVFGNKTDLEKWKLLAKDGPNLTNQNLQYYEFVKSPALAPSDVRVDIAATQKNKANLIVAERQLLTDDGDNYEVEGDRLAQFARQRILPLINSGNGEPTELLADKGK